MNINQATQNDVNEIAELFDQYRVFYGMASDIGVGKAFLNERLQNAESVIFLARDELGKAIGFTQLYPTFSSVKLVRRWILNDLFVTKTARKKGYAEALMQCAEDFALQSGAQGLSLSTACDNVSAQSLYEKRGWKKVTAFYSYNKQL